MAERIVITGLGAVTPLGLSAQESWESAVNGVSGVGPITHIDTSDYLVHIACEVAICHCRRKRSHGACRFTSHR